MPAAMAWPPPFTSRPSVTAWRTARPRSTPGIERPEPEPTSPGPSATAKAGRPNRSFKRAATRPTTPGMPARRGGDHGGAAVLEAERRHRLRLGFGDRGDLDRLALAVEMVELGGHRGRFRGVLAQQQPGAEIGAPDPAAGIDARSQHEAEMPWLRRPGEPRRIDQRGEPDPLAPPHRDQALGDEGAVEADEGHHVGDGAERDEIDEVEQVRLGPRCIPEAAAAQLAVHRDDGQEHQADGGEMAERREIVVPVRIDDRRLGQLLVGLMVVDDDGIEAEPRGFRERLEARGAAVDGDEELRAALGERADRLDVRPVALEDAVGNVEQRIEAAAAQEAREQRRRGRAVDVVVAEDGDGLAALDRIGDARRRRPPCR